MIPLADLHTHTKLCGHADGEPAAYWETARRKKLAFLGVSDHFPAPDGYDADNRMLMLEYPQYRAIVADLRALAARSGDGPEVLYGTEFDYVPGRMQEVYAALDQEDFDYRIASIHYVGDFGYDDPARIEEWKTRGAEAVWEGYLDLLCELVNGYDFEIIGHLDLPKKFGFRHPDEAQYLTRMTSVLELAAWRGRFLEINTAGLRRVVHELHPEFQLLRLACANQIPITFGSDAHTPADVGRDFDHALAAARAAGYRCAYAFRHGQPIELPFD